MYESLNEKFDVEPTTPPEPSPTVPDEEMSDEEKSRLALRDMIDKGRLAVENALALAEGTEAPRAYEVLAQMIKTVSDASKDLMTLQKIKKDIGKPEKGSGGPRTQNNLFVGSTTELLKALKQANLEVIPAESANLIDKP